ASRVRRTSPGLSSTSRISTGREMLVALIGCSRSHGDGEKEGGAGSGLGLEPDPTAVALHHLLADRQANPGSRVVGPAVKALEEHENTVGIFRRDSDAVVRHGEDPLPAFQASGYVNPWGFVRSVELQRIRDEVLEQLIHLARIGKDLGELIARHRRS